MNDSIIVNGIEMDYIRFGTGERIFVILPGVDTKSILNSAMAIEAGYRAFAKSYTVYVFDRRKNMPDDYTIRGMASDTAEVMTALGLRDADIFGASQGGMMGMCIAIDHPGLVRRLVVGSSSARITPEINEGTKRWIELAERGDMTALTADFVDNLYSEETIGKYRDFLISATSTASSYRLRRSKTSISMMNWIRSSARPS